MKKKTATLLLAACMLISLFSGLTPYASAEDAAEPGEEGGATAAPQEGFGSEAGLREGGGDIYDVAEDVGQIELMDGSALYGEAAALGIVDYSAVNEETAAVTRAQMAELMAGCLYRDSTPLSGYEAQSAFADVSEAALGTATYKAILWCADMGFFKGDADGNFNPDDTLSKAAAGVLIFRMLGRTDTSYDGSFELLDVPGSGTWYSVPVLTLYELGILSADYGAFNPDSLVSGADILRWLVSMKHFETDRRVLNFAELKEALEDGGVQSVTVTRAVELTESLTANKNLCFLGGLAIYEEGVTLTVESGRTELAGPGDAASNIGGGSIEVQAGADLYCMQDTCIYEKAALSVSGTVRVMPGCRLILGGEASLYPSGVIELSKSGQEGVDHGGLILDGAVFNKDGAAGGRIVSEPGGGWVKCRSEYIYENGSPVRDGSRDPLANVTLENVDFRAGRAVASVSSAEDFNSAVTDAELMFAEIYVAGSFGIAGLPGEPALDENVRCKKVFIRPGAELTFEADATVPESVLITLMYDGESGGYGALRIAEGSVLTVRSDWSLDGQDNMEGLCFEKEGYWEEAFGGVIGGYSDDADDGIRNLSYRELYFAPRSAGYNAGPQLIEAASELETVSYFICGGGTELSLNSQAFGAGELLVSNLLVVGGAEAAIESGFTVRAARLAVTGWTNVGDQTEYGRDYYYEAWAPGYVLVSGGASLTVEGELKAAAPCSWKHVIVISADEAANYTVGENNVVFVGQDAKLAAEMGVEPSSWLVVFEDDGWVWKSRIDVEGGFLTLGETGSVSAQGAIIGITPENVSSPGCGFAFADMKSLDMEWYRYQFNRDMEIDGSVTVPGYADINAALTVSGSLNVQGALSVYGALKLKDAGAALAGSGIHRMYYMVEDGSYRLAGLEGVGDYYVGAGDSNAFADLLARPELYQNGKLSLMFDWYLNENSEPPAGDLTIDADLYAPFSIQVGDGRRLTVNGTLECGMYAKAYNGAVVSASALITDSGCNLEAVDGARVIAGEAVNNGRMSGYNGGQVWLTGSVENNGSFDRNVYYEGLAAKWLNWDGSGVYEPGDGDLVNSLVLQRCSYWLAFYRMCFDEQSQSWELTPAPASELALEALENGAPDQSYVKNLILDNYVYDYYSELSLDGWKKYRLSCDAGEGKSYAMDISVELPEVGFYDSPVCAVEVEPGAALDGSGILVYNPETEAYEPAEGFAQSGTAYYKYGPAEENWTNYFLYTPGTEKTIYFIYNDAVNPENWAGDYVLHNFGSRFEVKKLYDRDSKVWELRLRDEARDSFSLNMGAELHDAYGNMWETNCWVELFAQDYEHLVWVHGDDFGNAVTEGTAVSGDGWYGAFYLYRQNEQGVWDYAPVPADSLVANGQPLASCSNVTLTEDQSRPGCYTLYFSDIGSYDFGCKSGGQACRYGVSISVTELPYLGPYSAPSADKSLYLNGVDYTSLGTVYMVPANGASLSRMSLAETELVVRGGGTEASSCFKWGDALSFGGFTVTAVDAEGDGNYDYFRVDISASPFSGAYSLELHVRDSNGNEFVAGNASFYSRAEQASSVENGGSLSEGADNASDIGQMAGQAVKYCDFLAQEEGWYAFSLTPEAASGDFGLYVFDKDWRLVALSRRYADSGAALRAAAYLEPGTYYAAVWNGTGGETSGAVMLAVVKSSRPAEPGPENARLVMDAEGVYSLRLSKGSSDAVEYNIYALIDGQWRGRGSRTLYYDAYLGRWNDEDCYLADILQDGETAAAFGVAAVNLDGIESGLYELYPDYPVARSDAEFAGAAEYSVKLSRLPDGQLIAEAAEDGRQVVFGRGEANRVFHYVVGPSNVYCDFESYFGAGNERAQLYGFSQNGLSQYGGGCWAYEISCQKLETSETGGRYIVGWSTAALDYDEGIAGEDYGRIEAADSSCWIVQDDADLSGTNEFRFNYGFSYWYTFNSLRFWLGTYSAERGYSYEEIKSGLSSPDVQLSYDGARWNFDLSGMEEGDAFRLIYDDANGKTASVAATVVHPDLAFFTTAEATKTSFLPDRVCSAQDSFYLVWTGEFAEGRGITGCEVAVYQAAAYDPDSGLTYYLRDEATGEFYAADNLEPDQGCFILGETLLEIDKTHYSENYIMFSNPEHNGDIMVSVSLTDAQNRIVQRRCLWVERAARLNPQGPGRLEGWVAESCPGSLFGVADSGNATQMSAVCTLNENRGLRFSGLYNGRDYYLYRYDGSAWVLVGGVSARCEGGPYIGQPSYGNGKMSVDYGLDASYAGCRLAAASYSGGRMLGVRLLTLDAGSVAGDRIELDLPEGEVYKVFLLSGDGRFDPVALD